ncbi:MAG: hypothetical protein ACRDQA_25270 [Nocardioidaceae bacterium]
MVVHAGGQARYELLIGVE